MLINKSFSYFKLLALGLLLLGSINTHAQQYGFEWIKTYQPYYKFLVGQTATHKINASALQAAGINLSTLNPKRLQLFCMGKEVPIYIAGEADNVFNSTDFIEFLGYKNNGNIDVELYANPVWQPNKFNGLFTDTTAYFLTILPDTTVQTPLRFTNWVDADFTGLQPELYFMDTVISAPAEEYLDGPDLMNASEKYTSSEYEDGEGWASVRTSWFNPQTYTLQTPMAYLSGLGPSIEYKIIGASNAITGSGKNHHVKIDVSPDGVNYTNLTDYKFYAYESYVFNPSINLSSIGNTTYIKFYGVNDLGVPSDYSSLSYVKLTYPRQYNLNGTGSKMIAVTHQRGGAKSYVQLQNIGSANNLVLYDFASNKRILALVNGGNAEFAVTNDNVKHPLWAFDSSATVQINRIVPVSFPSINPAAAYNYIIVSHPVLEPAAENYKTYRSLKFNTLKVYTEQLYDYYFYGNNNPLAIRKLMQHLVQNQTIPPQYLLLAGRGYQNDKARFYSISSQNPIENYNKNLIPGFGVPGADALYSSAINGNGYYAEVPTGRIPATNNQELQNYLEKVIAYEMSPDSIAAWRKNVLHVSGGAKESEQYNFRTILSNNAAVITSNNIGAKVTAVSKTTNSPTQADLRERLIELQNSGVNLVSFLGHASLTILDVDIGTVGELNNQNKYPLYYFSGCNVGNATEVDIATGDGVNAKDYICTANKGAIGWLAHSNFTFDGFLPPLINNFYLNYTRNTYGASIGQLMYKVTKDLSNNSPITKSHNIQWVLQGDPAATLYSPSAPDYAITPSDVFVSNENLSVQDEFINLGIILNNLGKTTTDSFNITVSRRLSNNQTITYPVIRNKSVFNKDTAFFKVEMLGELALGNNLFEIKIDAANEVAEIFENNNIIAVNIFVPGNGSGIIYPQKDALVGNDTIWLTVQNNNILSTTNEFIIEVDTVKDFSSLSKINTGILPSDAILRWPFLPKATDTTTYYWRAKLNIPEAQGGRWVNSVFVFIPNHEEGWMQRNFDRKIDLSSIDLLQVDTNQKRVDFSENSAAANLKSNRLAHGGRGLFYDGENQNPGSLSCTSNGFFAILIDKRTLRMFINPRFPMNCTNVINNNNNPSLRKLFYYGFSNSPAGQAEFQRFVDSLDAGTYVAIWSVYDNGNATWTPQMRSAFAKLGSTKVANANNSNTTFCMMGVAGAQAGSIAEDTITVLATDTNAEVSTVLFGKWFTANATSRLIGPAKVWKNMSYVFNGTENDGNDWDKIDVYGISSTNTDTLLIANAINNQDLTSVNAAKFPYLKLKYTLFDTMYRTPDQLNYWMIKYQPAPEGTISVNDGFSFYNGQLEQGDSVRLSVAFRNVSQVAFDSMPIYMRVLDANRTLKYEWHGLYPRFSPNEVIKLTHQIATANLDGQHALEVYFNEGNQPEVTRVNNYLFKSFHVKADKINPVLDVTFDGYRIIDGDYVSPTPTIRVTSKDDNKFKLQTDTSSFVLFLRKPSDLDYVKLNIQDAEMNFTPASNSNNKAMLEFKPKLTEDGLYSFKVLSKDASGNISGSDFYDIDFNVTKKSSITNFFPYPNPATTNVKFVFTLTGATPPDQLLIRIMTITGKVVKEITKDEFGPIKIGQNISEYSWDGTDNFGDRLANGVYLYQVLTRINGQNIEKRQTLADQYFVENVGKIYLMK